MKVSSFEAIVHALNDAGVRYLVVGGLAVNAYGYGRTTYDVDLVIELTPDSVQRAFSALAKIGYHPLVPIQASEFGNAERREEIIQDKNMVVLQFFSDAHRETRLDVFVREPFDFPKEYELRTRQELSPGFEVPLLRLPKLVELKQLAGRDKDLLDLENLRLIYGPDYTLSPEN